MSKQVALVLGSGGARGYAHIGVIEELEARGYEITCIAGCSMGSVIGGIYAAGKLREYREWVESLDYLDVLRLLDVSFRLGAIRGERVFGKIHEILGEVNIEDLSIPYTAVATDLTNQQEIWFQEGCLHQAMRASAAIPSLFTPVMQGSRMLVDGGLLNPLPIVPVVSAHSDLIIAVNLNATNQKQYHLPVIERPAALKGRFDSMIESLGHKLSFFRRHGDDNTLAGAERRRPAPSGSGGIRGARRAATATAGRGAARQGLAEVGQRHHGGGKQRSGIAAGTGQPELRGDADLAGAVQDRRLPAGHPDQRAEAGLPLLRVLQGAGIDRPRPADRQRHPGPLRGRQRLSLSG